MKRICLAILMVILSLNIFAKDIGYIEYIDGFVDIQRNGEILEIDNAFIGDLVYDFDVFDVYSDASIIIILNSIENQARIVVSENTTFKLEASSYGGQNRTKVDLLKGSVALTVNRLQSNESLNVGAHSVAMGVRGTSFEVFQAVDGSILVSCTEGKVEVEDDRVKGHVVPGQIAVKNTNEALQGYPVGVEDIELYKSFWQNQREDIFRRSGGTFVKTYYDHYNNIKDSFLEAYKELNTYRSRLLSIAQGTSILTTADLMILRKDVSPSAIKLRSTLGFMDHVYYSIETFMQNRHMINESEMLTRTISIRQFFSSFSQQQPELRNALVESRYLLKLFVQLSSMAAGGLDSDPFMENLMDGFMQGMPPGGGFPSGGF